MAEILDQRTPSYVVEDYPPVPPVVEVSAERIASRRIQAAVAAGALGVINTSTPAQRFGSH